LPSTYESFNDAIDGQIGSFLLNNGVKLSKDDVAYALIVDSVEARLASVSGKSWKVEATRVRNAGRDCEAVAVIVFYITNVMFKRIAYYSAIISPPVFEMRHTPSILWSVDVSDVNFVNF